MDHWYDNIDSVKLACIAALLILVGDVLMFTAVFAAAKKLDLIKVSNVDNLEH